MNDQKTSSSTSPSASWILICTTSAAVTDSDLHKPLQRMCILSTRHDRSHCNNGRSDSFSDCRARRAFTVLVWSINSHGYIGVGDGVRRAPSPTKNREIIFFRQISCKIRASVNFFIHIFSGKNILAPKVDWAATPMHGYVIMACWSV